PGLRSGAVPLSRDRASPGGWLVVGPRVAPRVWSPTRSPRPRWWRIRLLHGRDFPAVAGELTSDRDGDDRAPFAAPLEVPPALVEPACDGFGSVADGSRLAGATTAERDARA